MELFFCLVVLSGAVCPGVLTVWHFAPTIGKEHGPALLLILGTAITLPIACINSIGILAGFGFFAAVGKKATPYICVSFGCFLCMVVVGVPLLLAFLFALSLKVFVWWAISLEAFWMLVFVYAFLDGRKLRKK
jgi:hypothetical protein